MVELMKETPMRKEPSFQAVWHALVLFIFLCSNTVIAFAGPKEEIAKLDKTQSELREEKKSLLRVRSEMKVILRNSSKLDAAIYSPDRLEPKGQAGTGVVGKGKNLSQGAKNATNTFESIANPQNIVGGPRMLNDIVGEQKRLRTAYRKKHGISKDQPLSPSAMKFTFDKAVSLAHLKSEIKRHAEAAARIDVTIAELTAKKQELFKQLNNEEREDYVRKRQAENKEKTEKDPAETKPPSPVLEEDKKPPFDKSNLVAAFWKFETLMNKQNALFKSVSNSCGKLPSRDQIKKNVGNLSQTPFKKLPLNVGLLRKEKVLSDRLLAILQEMQTLENSAFSDGDAACKITGTGEPRLDPIRAAGARSQKTGEKAKILRASAKKIHNELIASHAKKLGNPKIDYLDFVSLQEKAVQNQCRSIGGSVENARYKMKHNNNGSELDKAAIRANTELESAETAKFVDADVYRIRYELYAQYKKNKLANAKTFAECEDRERYLAGECASLRREFGKRAQTQQNTQYGLIDGLVANRKSQLAVANRAMSRINRLAARVYVAVVATNSCVVDAESKVLSKPNPQTVAEAAQLGNTSSLICNSSDIDQRIAQLRLPKFSKLPNVPQQIAHLQAKKALIEKANAQIDEAKAHFGKSLPGSARRSLQAARTTLAQLNNAPPCPVLDGRISKGESQINELDRILSSARGALSSCNPRQLQAAVRAIGRKRNVPEKVARAKARMERQLRVLRLLRDASKLYNSGDLKGAQRLISQARSLRAKSGSRDCPALDQRIQNAQAAVARQQGQADQAMQAANSCDTATLGDIRRDLNKKRGKFVKSFKAQITKSMKVCRQENKDRQAERDRQEKEESLRAAGQRQSTCRDKYGSGYRAGKVNKNGKYFCLPSKRTANAWCNKNSTGTGWRAHSFNGRGGFKCRKSRRAVTRTARADCRRQYGSRYSHTVVKRSGRYTCHFCPRGQYARKGRCYSRRTTVRRTPKYTCPRGYYLRGRRCFSSRRVPRTGTRRPPRRNTGISVPAHPSAITGGYVCSHGWTLRGSLCYK